MSFTRQDLYTLLIGLGAAVAIQVGTSLVQLDSEQIEDMQAWAISLGTGLAGAVGRYLVTELTQRGFGRG